MPFLRRSFGLLVTYDVLIQPKPFNVKAIQDRWLVASELSGELIINIAVKRVLRNVYSICFKCVLHTLLRV